MTTKIFFTCPECERTEALTLEAFQTDGFPHCPEHKSRMVACDTADDEEFNRALEEAMDAMTNLAIVVYRRRSEPEV